MSGEPDVERNGVAIGLITAANVRVEHATSVITALQDHSVDNYIVVPCGPYLDMGRNLVVETFLATPHEWLLFVDSDIAFTSEDVDRMVEAADWFHDHDGVYPVIGGAYLGSVKGQRSPIAYRWVDNPNPDTNQRIYNPIPVDEIRDNTDCVSVDAIGTGFMLIHYTILEHFAVSYNQPQQWFAEMPLDDGSGEGCWFGEDLIFCMRAIALGHPVLCHRGVRLTHYKDLGLTFD